MLHRNRACRLFIPAWILLRWLAMRLNNTRLCGNLLGLRLLQSDGEFPIIPEIVQKSHALSSDKRYITNEYLGAIRPLITVGVSHSFSHAKAISIREFVQ